MSCESRSLRDEVPCELALGHEGPHRHGKRCWSAGGPALRPSGASGRTLARAQRQARGDVQVAVWLEPEDALLLAELEAGDPGEGARTRIVRRALRVLHRLGGSGDEA